MSNPQDDAPSASRYLVRSELMQSYAAAAPFMANPVIASVIDRDGQPQVFSIGSDNDIYNLSATDDVKTWAALKMRAPAPVQSFAVGRDVRGNIVVFVAGTDNHVYWISDRRFEGWHDLGTPFGTAATIDSIRTGYDAEGVLLAMVSAAYTGGGQAVYEIHWNDADSAWDYVSPIFLAGTELYDLVPGSVGTVDGAFVAGSFEQLKAGAVAFFPLFRVVPIDTDYRSQTDDIVALTGVRIGDGQTQVFGLDEQGAAWMVGKGMLDEPSVNLSGNLATTTKLTCIRAGIHRRGEGALLELFAIGDNGELYHTRQYRDPEGTDGAPAKPVWGEMISLGGSLYVGPDSLAVCSDATGASQCFAVTKDGYLIWFAQNQNLEWNVRPVTVPYIGKLEEFAAYSTQVALVDQYGIPLPDHPLTISTSVDVRASVNGKMFSTGPRNPVVCATNAAGRLTVVVPTLALGTPSIVVDGGPAEDGYVISIRPDQGTQEKIDGPVDGNPTTWENVKTTLLDATVNGEPLIPSEYSQNKAVMDGVAKAVHGSLSLAQQDPGDLPQWARSADRHGDIRGVRVIPRAGAALRSDAIDPRRVAEQHWHVTFTPAGPLFSPLRHRGEAMDLVARLAAGAADLPSSHRPDWGTFWRSVQRGAVKLKNLVVTTLTEIVDKTKTIVSRIEVYIETKAKQFLNYVVDKVQMAFDIVQGVFEEIAVKFKQLFEWLGTLFQWQDVLLIKNDTKALVSKALAAAPAQIKLVEASILKYLAGLKADLNLGPYANSTFGSEVKRVNEQSSGKAPGPAANFVETQLVDGQVGGPGVLDVKLSGETAAFVAIAKFLHDVETALESKIPQLWVEFRQAILQGKNLADLTPGELLNAFGKLIALGVLEILQTLVEQVFELLVGLTTAATEILNHKWEIPVISRLYKVIDPAGELTFLDLICLLMAVPTTFAMKALGATFPSTSAADVITSLTPGQLFGHEPLSASQAMALRHVGLIADEKKDPSKHLFAMAALGYSFSFGLVATWTANISRFLLGKKLVYALGRVDTVWRLVGAALGTVTWIISYDFYFVSIESDAQKTALANWVIAGTQTLAVDLLPAIMQMFMMRSDNFAEKAAAYGRAHEILDKEQNQPFIDYLAGLATETRQGERKNLWIQRANKALDWFGFVLSFGLVAGFCIQANYERKEIHDPSAGDIAWIALKAVQNILTTWDHIILPFESLLEEGPYAKAFYAGSTGLADGGAAIINAVRAYHTWPDIPHLNM